MAKEKIVLAELDLDIKALIEAAAESKDAIKALTKELEKCEKAGKKLSSEYKNLEKELDNVTDAYEAQKDAISAQIEIQQTLANQQNTLVAAQQNIATAIQKATTATDKQGNTFADYKQKVKDAFNEINIFNGGLTGLGERAEEAGGMKSLFTGAFTSITTGIKGMGAAISANPLGVLLQILGPIIEQFKKFTPLTNAVEKAMAGLSPVINLVTAPIKLLAEGITWVVDGLTDFIGSMSETANEAIKLKQAQQDLATEMKVQEVLNAKAKNDIDEKLRQSENLTLSEEERMQALKDAMDIERENFNERKTQAQQSYNNAVNAISQSNGLTDAEIANLTKKGYAYAQDLAKRKGISDEELDALRTAQLEKENLTGEEKAMLSKHHTDLLAMESGFLAKRQSDEDKAAADRERKRNEWLQKEKKRVSDAIETQRLELKLLMQTEKGKKRTMEEELALANTVAEKKKAIAQSEYDASEKTENDRLRLKIANRAIETDLAETQMNVALNNAKQELDTYIANNKTKIAEGQALTDELIAQEKARLDGIAAETKKYEKQRMLNGEISQQEYNNTIDAIDADNKATQDTLNDDYTEQKRAKKAEDLALDTEIALAQADSEYEEKVIRENARHEQAMATLKQRLDDDQITQAEYDILAESEKQDHTDNMKKLDDEVQKNKVALAENALATMANILGKESKAGKAVAVAQATMDTFKAAVSAYSAMAPIPFVGPALGAVAAGAAVAAGLANVKKITSTKPPKAEKGALFGIGGQRHSAGGTMFTGEDGTAFEAEQGELIGVMNRNAARHFMAFNNAFPSGAGSAPNYFASGGIVSRDIASPSLNADELALKISDANRSLPQPVVAVQDIVTEGNSFVQVRQGADF